MMMVILQKKNYMSLVEIKDFNGLIENKTFFDQLLKNKQEVYEKLVEILRSSDYTIGNLLECSHQQNIINSLA